MASQPPPNPSVPRPAQSLLATLLAHPQNVRGERQAFWPRPRQSRPTQQPTLATAQFEACVRTMLPGGRRQELWPTSRQGMRKVLVDDREAS